MCLISSGRTFFNIFAPFAIHLYYLSIKKGGVILVEGKYFWNRTDAKYMQAWVDAYSVGYASTDKFGRWIIRAYNSDGQEERALVIHSEFPRILWLPVFGERKSSRARSRKIYDGSGSVSGSTEPLYNDVVLIVKERCVYDASSKEL